MKILVAEDNLGFRLSLESVLAQWGYEVVSATDGLTAWQILRQETAPALAILDWMMPGMSGLEVCACLREQTDSRKPYVILLTGRISKEDTVQGLEQGADDYLTKPVDFEELRARVNAGRRIMTLQHRLTERVAELEDALSRVRQLEGLLPICCYCKKIRDDQNYWQQVETYISRRAAVQFSHGICPDCMESVVKPELERLQARQTKTGA